MGMIMSLLRCAPTAIQHGVFVILLAQIFHPGVGARRAILSNADKMLDLTLLAPKHPFCPLDILLALTNALPQMVLIVTCSA